MSNVHKDHCLLAANRALRRSIGGGLGKGDVNTSVGDKGVEPGWKRGYLDREKVWNVQKCRKQTERYRRK